MTTVYIDTILVFGVKSMKLCNLAQNLLHSIADLLWPERISVAEGLYIYRSKIAINTYYIRQFVALEMVQSFWTSEQVSILLSSLDNFSQNDAIEAVFDVANAKFHLIREGKSILINTKIFLSFGRYVTNRGNILTALYKFKKLRQNEVTSND